MNDFCVAPSENTYVLKLSSTGQVISNDHVVAIRHTEQYPIEYIKHDGSTITNDEVDIIATRGSFTVNLTGITADSMYKSLEMVCFHSIRSFMQFIKDSPIDRLRSWHNQGLAYQLRTITGLAYDK